MSGEVEFVSSEFDIFVKNPIQSSILGTDVVRYKSIATVDQNVLEFFVPGDNETYIDQDIKLYVRGRIIGADGKDLDVSDFTAGINNFLNSLFSQCSISLNRVNITPTSELYPYRSYLETVLTYGSDASNSHLTNAYWYLVEGASRQGIRHLPTSRTKALSSDGSVKNKVIELYGRLHADICNVPQFLLSGVRMQIRLT